MPLANDIFMTHCVVSNCVGNNLFTTFGSTEVYNSLIVNNTQTDRINSSYHCFAVGYYYNCTLIGNKNTSTIDTHGILGNFSAARNCIVFDSEPRDIDSSIHSAATNTLYGTSNASAANNARFIATINPRFNMGLLPELPYYSLLSGSPAIDKGASFASVKTDALDLARNERVVGDAIDLGCYEWYPIEGAEAADVRLVDPSGNFNFGSGFSGAKRHTSFMEALTAMKINERAVLAPGDYACSGVLTVPSFCSVEAFDPDPAKTRLVGDEESDTSIVFETTGSILSGLTVMNFKSSTSSIIGNDASVGTLTNCVIQSCKASALTNSVIKAFSLTDSKVQDCETEDADLIRIADYGTYADVILSNNVARSEILGTLGLVRCDGGRFYRASFIGNRVISNCETSSVVSAGLIGLNNGLNAIDSKTSYAFDSVFLDNLATNKFNKGNLYFFPGNVSNSVIAACTMPLATIGKISHCIVSNCVGKNVFETIAGAEARNTLFVNNIQTDRSGSHYHGWLVGFFYNCTFVGNKDIGPNRYGILGGFGRCKNCIVFGNSPRDVESNLNTTLVTNTLYGTTNLGTPHPCIIQTDDPKFNLGRKPELPYYALRKNSPAVDAGDVALNPTPKDVIDLAQNPRIAGAAIDLGCYEYIPAKPGLRLILR